MIKYSKIKSPILCVNKQKIANNISQMMAGLPETCIFRPHFKTHNNKVTASIFKKFGIDKITVSSVEMAEYFRHLGFRDITIAFPVNLREEKRLNKLSKNTKLGITISNLYSAQRIVTLKTISADAWIEIDTGHNRSGILFNRFDEIEQIIKIIKKSSNLQFKGFLTHSGQTYKCSGRAEIFSVSKDSYDKMIFLKEYFKDYSPIVSVGDTPSCIVYRKFDQIDEIRPGNFVYYDLMMYKKEVCRLDEIAVKVVCPVVDIHSERNQIIIHGGSVHFGNEFINEYAKPVYGMLISHIEQQNINPLCEYLISLSQEHGIAEIQNYDIKKIKVGDLVEIIPVHSCLTANYMKNYTLHY